MKTLFLTIFASTLPFTALVAYNEIRSALNVAEIERVRNLPVSVSIPSSEVEVDFIPTHSLYQKRCLVEGELVYCADTDALATVSVVEEEIEIEYVPSQEEPRNVVCGEYTCTFTPSSFDGFADAE